jgi:hypothetical protein
MNEMMTFPNTWEEFEKLYGFNDVEKIYTNNSRLIPSFRVKQWLDHLSSVQSNVPDTSVGELINKYEAIEAIINKPAWHNSEESWYHGSDIRQALKELPPAQPERKKGEWIRNDNGTYSCSICKSWIPEEQHHYARYCLYCGADMGGSLNV